jgi:large repetitive protein
MKLNRPQDAATESAQATGFLRRRIGAGAIRVLSVTAVAAATCTLWAGAASAAPAVPAAGTATTTTITNSSPGTVDAGDPYTIDVAVAGGGGTPTGTVTVSPSDATLPTSYSCTVTLAAGAGSCQVTPGAGTFGDIDYTATYSGDGTFAGSTSGTFVLIVPETTTTTISPGTAAPGAVTLEATVVGQAMGNISPAAGGSGTVQFSNGGTVIAGCGAAALTYDGGGANIAKCDVTLAAGSYTIAANYSGDPNNLKSGVTETLVVKAGTPPPPVKHATKTRGSASPTSTKVRHLVTLSATVTSPGRTPGGKVTFMSAGHVLCTARLSHGKAHCSYRFKAAGKHEVRAWYAGSSTFDRSHSAFFAVKVKK